MKRALFILPLAATVSYVASPQTVPPARDVRVSGRCETATESATEHNKALVTRWYDALRSKDMATARALVTDDWVIHGTHRELARGPEGVKQWQAVIDTMWFVPRPAITEDMIAEGDKVVRRTTVYRTYRLNNKESAMDAIFIHRIAHCKIAEVWRVVDALSSLQQIGAKIIMPGAKAAAPSEKLRTP